MTITLPDNEVQRLEALLKYSILDTEKDDVYDTVCKLAASIMETPAAFITFVDAERSWAKASYGLDIQESSREHSFCAYCILNPSEPLIVKDATLDERFSNNPYVMSDPNIRFYFGYPLVTANQEAIGAICGVDSVARKAPTHFQIDALSSLSKLVMSHLEFRNHMISIHKEFQTLKTKKFTPENTIDWYETFNKLNDNCDALLEKIKTRKASKEEIK